MATTKQAMLALHQGAMTLTLNCSYLLPKLKSIIGYFKTTGPIGGGGLEARVPSVAVSCGAVGVAGRGSHLVGHIKAASPPVMPDFVAGSLGGLAPSTRWAHW